MNSQPTINIKELYLDYTNNFLTVQRFAEYHGISEELAQMIINEAKNLIEFERSLRCKKIIELQCNQ